MNTKKVLCIVAGRSGGHILPGIIYANNFMSMHPEYSVLFFSTDAALDRSLLALYPDRFSSVALSLSNVPGKKVWRYPLFLGQFLRAFYRSFKYLYRERPDRVVSMGGYISLPVCLAAWVLRIPIELFELNAVPGKAVLWLAPLARTIYVCFKEASSFFDPQKTQIEEYPLRFSPSNLMTKAQSRAQLGLDREKKTLLIVGGSQGSRSINDLMLSFLKSDQELWPTIQIIHQVGSQDGAQVDAFYKERGVQAVVFDYAHDLQYSYAAADLVIARAGAGTLFELAFFEKKSIIIPLEVASTAHQVDNALAMMHMRPDLFKLVCQREIQANPKKFYQDVAQRLIKVGDASDIVS